MDQEPINILVVEDEQQGLDILAEAARGEGRVVRLATDVGSAVSAIENHRIDCIISDLELGDVSGLDILRAAAAQPRPIPVIVVTGFATVESAVEAMQLGAAHYVAKPVDLDDLRTTVDRTLERRRMIAGAAEAAPDISSEFGGLIGSSPALQRVIRQIRRAAPFSSTVLITGESGTGKELVARAIHAVSAVSDGPFVAVNCSSLPRDLVESQLFGHERGSFTGAAARQIGFFEAAEGGTLFLDEIGDLAAEAQAKVLRALERKEIVRLGSTRPTTVDIRLLAATNVDLRAAVERGTFREDLYYRLNVLHITLPPLRERPEDVPILVSRFVDRVAREHGLDTKRVDDDVIQCLQSYRWPGNVRELKNTAERLFVMAEGETITIDDLPADILQTTGGAGPLEDPAAFRNMTIDEIERRVITRTLQETGSQQQTADQLGISLRTLQRRLREYGI